MRLGVKLLQSINLAEVYLIKTPLCYYIQQKSPQNKSSLQQVIIILLIGLNVLKLEVKWLFSLFARAGEVDMCADGGRGSEARPSILPVQLPEASHLSVPDLTRTERKRDH